MAIRVFGVGCKMTDEEVLDMVKKRFGIGVVRGQLTRKPLSEESIELLKEFGLYGESAADSEDTEADREVGE